MGLNTIPAVPGLTRNVVAFTSSQTWTVPASAQYVDVLVIGGGGGGRGGYRTTYASDGGSLWGGGGGGVTMLRDIFLGGTGTVSVVVGAGASGTAGTATTSISANPSRAGWSGFGTFCYSSGAGSSNVSGTPGYKGSADLTSTADFRLWKDTNQSNWAPALESGGANATAIQFYGQSTDSTQVMNNINATGLFGGRTGSISGSNDSVFRAGGHPGFGTPSDLNPASAIYTNTLTQIFPSSYTAFAGAATAGSSGGGSGAVGAAGQQGFAGGGGTAGRAVNLPGGQGGPGAGGGPSTQASTGTNGGNGGNAGTNTGAGGGGGGNTGSTSAGTGGNGGNGGSGIVIVSWLG